MQKTEKEMIEYRRKRAGFEPLDEGCSVERFDGINLDEAIRETTRQWYLNLLDEGDEGKLHLTDVAPMSTIEAMSEGKVRIRLPAGTRRVISVDTGYWKKGCRPADKEKREETERRCRNRWTAPTNERPAAWMGAERSELWISPGMEDGREPEGLKIMAAYDTGDGIYRFDESALESLDEWRIV